MKEIPHKVEDGVELKFCSDCGNWKTLDSFGKNCRTKDKLYNICRLCKVVKDHLYHIKNHAARRQRQTLYYQETAEDRRAYMKKYCKENKEDINKRRVERRLANLDASREKERILSRKYYLKNINKLRERSKEYRERMSKLPWYRINRNLSSSVNRCLKDRDISKNHIQHEKILGYNLEEFVNTISKLFIEEMSFDNYGRSSGAERWWEVDHKIPQSWFKFKSVEDPLFKECWALSNLQPKWQYENKSKGARYADQ